MPQDLIIYIVGLFEYETLSSFGNLRLREKEDINEAFKSDLERIQSTKKEFSY